MFDLTTQEINAQEWRSLLLDNPKCGAFTSFEGWVRCHNEGRQVAYLVYSVYEELARREGEEIIQQAKQRFAIEDAVCVHRYGRLEIGEMAVWVGVSAGHRDPAFTACRFIIDEIKRRVPIWKQEFYHDIEEVYWLANPQD